VSAPKLHPPKLTASSPTAKKGLAGGDFLLTNQPSVGSRLKLVGNGGPFILNGHLQPVWVNPIGTKLVAGNLKRQSYNGKPALTWWQGTFTPQGVPTSGEDVVVDNTYRTVATVKGADGWVISEHDMVISGHDAWVTAYKSVPKNLTHYGGSAKGSVLDAAVQEYDLSAPGGKLLYTWDALTKIPLSASYQAAPKSGLWDAYHVNSIQLVSGSRFLVSMRQEWAAYLVSATTSGIEWQLGGKHSTFKFGKGAEFEWQHDVELHGNKVSIFDDQCCGVSKTGSFIAPTGFSRALVLTLDTSKHTATQTLSIRSGRSGDATFLGNTQLLPNGNLLVSWGNTPFFSEYSKTGKLLLGARWPTNGGVSNVTYRAYLANWNATPYYPPNGAVRASKGKATVYASWNGATGVSAWRVLAGTSSSHLATVVRKAGRSGFETAIKLSKTYKTYEVEALNSHGKVIRTSKPFPTPNSGGGHFY
jgi:Arylsulfotransferase (ASST)